MKYVIVGAAKNLKDVMVNSLHKLNVLKQFWIQLFYLICYPCSQYIIDSIRNIQ